MNLLRIPVKEHFQIGEKIGKLTILSYANFTKNGRNKLHFWNTKCECGTVKKIAHKRLINKNSDWSCGCELRKKVGDRFRTHGLKQHPSYESWKGMLSRCTDSKNKEFHNYGARGIKIEDTRWYDVRNFIADMGERPNGLTLERINVNQGYQKSNCRWATWKEQARNRRNNHLITFNGETHHLIDWAEKMECDASKILHRLKYGWDIERVLTK